MQVYHHREVLRPGKQCRECADVQIGGEKQEKVIFEQVIERFQHVSWLEVIGESFTDAGCGAFGFGLTIMLSSIESFLDASKLISFWVPNYCPIDVHKILTFQLL